MKKVRPRFFKLIFIILVILLIRTMNNHNPEVGRKPDDLLVLVNREHSLPINYEPKDLVEPDLSFSQAATKEERMLRKEAAKALEALFKEGERNGNQLCCISGYRPYESQLSLYESRLEKVGKTMTDKYVAYPGHSEHQTGLAMDVSSLKAIRGSDKSDFGQTEEGIWLKDNAYKFGFIIRYPKEKEAVTKYNYEPWHIRYIGKKAAKEIKSKNLALEEYLDTDSKFEQLFEITKEAFTKIKGFIINII